MLHLSSFLSDHRWMVETFLQPKPLLYKRPYCHKVVNAY